jgi:hypothetical protein
MEATTWFKQDWLGEGKMVERSMPSARFHTLLIAVKLALQLVLFGTVKMG